MGNSGKDHSLKVDFYRVELSDTAEPLAEVMRGLIKRDVKERTVDVGGALPHRLEELAAGQYLEGNVLKIRMDDLPVRASVEKPGVQQIEIDDDEGIGEETAFFFAPRLQVIAIQRNRYGLGATPLCRYFRHFFRDQQEAMLFTQILTEDAQMKLEAIDEVRSFEMELAGSIGDFWQDRNVPMKVLGKLATEADAPRVGITLKMGHHKGGMNSGFLKSVAKAFMSVADVGGKLNRVSKLEIGGKVGPDETLIVDLISDRLVAEERFRSDVRGVLYAQRRTAVANGFRQHQKYLEKRFGK